MSSWPVWISIALLFDAGVGLWNAHRLAAMIPPRRLMWIAALEAALAAGLAAWHWGWR